MDRPPDPRRLGGVGVRVVVSPGGSGRTGIICFVGSALVPFVEILWFHDEPPSPNGQTFKALEQRPSKPEARQF